MTSRVLIIGAQGQLARSLIQSDAREGMHLRSMGRPVLDLTDPISIEKAIEVFRPTVIVNAAAYTAVDEAETNSDIAFSVNADGPRRLADLSAEANIPIIHISTDYVFDGEKEAPYSEADLVDPLGVYGKSKLAGEIAIAERTPLHIILRTAWVHSEFGKNFTKTMLALARSRDVINVVDDQVGSPTYAPHLANGILAICEQISEVSDLSNMNWGTYHLAGEGYASWADFAVAIMQECDDVGHETATINRISTAEYPTTAPRPANSKLELKAIKSDWNVTLPPWRQGVIECVRKLVARNDHS